jgi:hypothetical protein
LGDAVFIGFYNNVWGMYNSEPKIAFKKLEDALKWKNEEKGRDFKLVEWL